ncbi:MAG: PP2C family protein-serine/threonine phosphatase [Candidatus Babeliales bacterium]
MKKFCLLIFCGLIFFNDLRCMLIFDKNLSIDNPGLSLNYSEQPEIDMLLSETSFLSALNNNSENKGIKVGLCHVQNKRYRRTMEDEHDVRLAQDHVFFSVFDGHGGKQVADYLKNNLYNNLISDQNFSTNIPAAIRFSFDKTDRDIVKEGIGARCGSTATTALIKNNKIYIANVGDSRTVLCDRNGNVLFESKDHKPNDPAEKARIEAAGGSVEECVGNISRVNRYLSVARAFGDSCMKTLIISTPDITELDLTPNMGFLILACDGLWDILTSEQVAEIVKNAPDVQCAAQQLAKEALNLNHPECPKGDNISVIVVDLRGLFGCCHVEQAETYSTGQIEIIESDLEDIEINQVSLNSESIENIKNKLNKYLTIIRNIYLSFSKADQANLANMQKQIRLICLKTRIGNLIKILNEK